MVVVDESKLTRPQVESTVQRKGMTRIKVWKDDDGYAFEFDDSRLELTEDGMNEFIEELRRLQSTNVDDGESIAKEFCVDLEDGNGE